MLTPADLSALWLTLKLATVVTIVLLIFGTPLALWLSSTRSWLRGPISAIVALPLVLPPTVLGFYLLIAMGPYGLLGQLGLEGLAFTFEGLVIASVLYSMPFVVQPLQNSLEAIGQRPYEVAKTLGAGPVDRFMSITLPLAAPGFITAAVLGFAHTVGEFGVVLMIGGDIPGETRVLSVAIYEYVETLQWRKAHLLAGGMVAFAFIVVLAVLLLNRRPVRQGASA